MEIVRVTMVSRFATKEEIFEEDFWKINQELLTINEKYLLPDHHEINLARFGWWKDAGIAPSYYGARFWEYPFALIAADLEQGLKCADVGCGTTPFTAFLADKVGAKNVTGYDPDLVESSSDERHSAFGVRRQFLDKIGINFAQDDLLNLSAPNDYFDRVFCISVLEHIDDFETQVRGLNEMVRVLKPGGRLILTMDVGIDTILTHPLDMVRYSGLSPLGLIDYRWPEQRFVKYGDATMDVFGLVLEKSSKLINDDYEGSKTRELYQANKKYKVLHDHYLMKYNEALFIKEKRKNSIKAIAKLLLGKYK
ncbi:MAG: class I SAM-dependent methyltransferase [Imperialibacter sp.]|uniref:class I SAM-dependent methyltransferase n=1 Tax=Imperialibacter sp. TaxID=2038411 RepID=UPI003A897A7A